MDGFEVARRAAAELHDALVAKGADPSRPLDLLARAAAAGGVAEHELEVCEIDRDDPLLGGADARFIAEDALILLARGMPPTTRAEAFAHELGHVRLDPTPRPCRARDLGPDPGLWAYGPRERRELEANVFGREFLLPRALASRLFLVERASARAIAERFGLSLDLVREQILDAVLVPEAEALPRGTDGAHDDETLDGAQLEAATHFGSALELLAGPGTGKTRTLVHRARTLVRRGADPSSIVVLTFSSKMAADLGERLHRGLGEAAEGIWVGTFHAFGRDLVRRYHERLGLAPDAKIVDQADALGMLEDVLPTLPLQHHQNLFRPALALREILGAIRRAKDAVVTAARFRELCEAMPPRDAARPKEIATVYERYELELAKRGALDLGDLLVRPVLLLERDEAARADARRRHVHLLVDEYQDVNEASARLVHALAGDGRNLWVVGDPRQSIYRFLGAGSETMASFADRYPGARTLRLEVGYRSTEAVLSASLSIARRMGASAGVPPLELRASRAASPGDEAVSASVHATPEEESEAIADAIEALRESGVPLGDQAVIARVTQRLDGVAEALARRGIPALHLGRLFDRSEVKELLAIASLAADRFAHGLPLVATMGAYDVPFEEVARVARRVRDDRGDRGGLRAELEASAEPGFRRLATDIAGFEPMTSTWELLATYLLDRTDHLRALAEDASFAARARGLGVRQLLAFVRDGLPVHETLDRLRRLALVGDDRDARPMPDRLDAVRLLTIHASKGLEFEAVHLAGVGHGELPLRFKKERRSLPPELAGDPRREHALEEECLFFVAASRAKRVLRLSRALRSTNAKAVRPAAFVSWCVEKEVYRARPADEGPRARSEPSRTAIKLPDAWTISDRALELLDRCPRRFLYTHVVGLGGGARRGPFSRTHGLVSGLARWMAERSLASDVEIDAELGARFRQARLPDEYWDLACELTARLCELTLGGARQPPAPMKVTTSAGAVSVTPHEVVLRRGEVVVRRLQTWASSHEDGAKLGERVLALAAREAHGPKVRVEMAYLAEGGRVRELDPSDDERLDETRRAVESLLTTAREGRFPKTQNRRECALCPHLFGCGDLPHGPLELA